MSYDPKPYWEDRAGTWINETFDFADWPEILERHGIDWNLPTIDIGCGTGWWSELFTNYTGYDISQRLVDYATKRYGDKFECVDIREREIKSDQIFDFSCLQHIPQKDFSQIKLKGRLFIIEPNIPSGVEHCYMHDYSKLGVKEVYKKGIISLWTNVQL